MSAKAPTGAMPAQLQCAAAAGFFRAYIEGTLDGTHAGQLADHLQTCGACKTGFEVQRRLVRMLDKAYSSKRISDGFEEKANERLAAARARTTGSVALPLRDTTSTSFAELEPIEGELEGVSQTNGVPFLIRLGGAPWWIVSTALHALVLLLAALISLAIIDDNSSVVIVVTHLEKQPEPKAEEEKQKEVDALNNPREVTPTDPNAKDLSDIQVVVPPDFQLSDHFETNNPDLPNTNTAHGVEDSKVFTPSNDTESGGGGTDGLASDDLIGVGGAGTVGSGGGFGGGNGTGLGTGTGSGTGSFGSRNGAGRANLLAKHGGNRATESAVDRALAWLARNQDADGHWDAHKLEGQGIKGDTAITGLALLAFLGAGHTEKIGKYRDNVKRGVAWLIKQQNAQGLLFAAGDNCTLGYAHGIAGLALAEAAGMGRIEETKAAAQKAVDYSTEIFQAGKGSEKLGWRYSPKELGDISVSGWFIMQLKSAKMAGLKVDQLAFEGANKYIDTVEYEKPKKDDPYSGHKYGYIADGNGPNGIRVKCAHNNTAIGCLGKLFLGTKPDELQGAVEWFVKEGGLPGTKKPQYYFWYYGTLCTFQMGGDVWKQWNEAMKKTLLDSQCKGGDKDGSWDPLGDSPENCERIGGRVFTTAIGALCLEVYYRYMLVGKH